MNESGSKCIGRMSSKSGNRVEIIESWIEFESFYDVRINGEIINFFAEDKKAAIEYARKQLS